ncbi:MAG: universal stress protein [Syntrophobacteraceae bacterium]
MIEYTNILFCTDFSDDANIAFLHALRLAAKFGARLHIIHIPHSPFVYAKNIVDEDIPESKLSEEGQAFFDQGIVDEAQMRLRREYEGRMGDFKSYTFVIACGSPEIEIIRYARKNDIDLIVMGALGKAEVDKLEHGSTVANVSRYAHCHVMAIRNPLKQFTLPIKG